MTMPAPARRPISCWRANSFAAGALPPPLHRSPHEQANMSQAPKPRGLGRGLSALLGDEEVASTVAPAASTQPTVAATSRLASRTPYTLPIAELRPGKFQPRTSFEGLDTL